MTGVMHHEELREIVANMRATASRVGPLHAWWDTILDIEAFLDCRETFLVKTSEEWLAFANYVYGNEPAEVER